MKFTPADDTDTRIRKTFHVVDAQPLLANGRVIDVHKVTVDARFRAGAPTEWVVELRGHFRDSGERALHTADFLPGQHSDPLHAVYTSMPVQAQPLFDVIAANAAQLHDQARGTDL